jgi:hypothetical protein
LRADGAEGLEAEESMYLEGLIDRLMGEGRIGPVNLNSIEV